MEERNAPCPTALFSSGLLGEIRRYIVGKYQADSQIWRERLGQPEPLAAFLRRVMEAYPQERAALLRLVLPRVDPFAESERARLKQAQMRRDGVVFFTDLPVGVPTAVSSFEDFLDRGNASVKRARAGVRAWVDRAGPPMLTLTGQTGTGKSHLSTAAGRALVERGEDVLYRSEGELFDDLRRAVRTSSVAEVLETFSSAPWLILDDLGTASITEGGMMEEMRDRLFDARWRGAGPWHGALRTLVTTNMLSQDLPTRVASRLKDSRWGDSVIVIDAPDYRIHQR